jgi:hypothetical protein
MIVEINFDPKYAIEIRILTRQDKDPTSSRLSMKTTIEHTTQSFTPATFPQQPRYASIW